jgi:hypothetical protein
MSPPYARWPPPGFPGAVLAHQGGHFLVIAFSSEVDTGSRKEKRQNKKLEPGSDSIRTGL